MYTLYLNKCTTYMYSIVFMIQLVSCSDIQPGGPGVSRKYQSRFALLPKKGIFAASIFFFLQLVPEIQTDGWLQLLSTVSNWLAAASPGNHKVTT